MTWWRSLLGALLIGLPTAVLAHGLTYGRGHVLGGSNHENVVQLTLALGMLAVVACGALALASARTAQNGSILASRLAVYVPGWGTLTLAAAGWFCTIEGMEPHHQGIAALAVTTIAISAWLVSLLAGGRPRALAQIAFAIFAAQSAPRHFLGQRLHAAPIVVHSRTVDRRRYARPPPFFA
jgi:hypothetical protein